MTKHRCPKCRRPVPAEAINATAGMALCAACAEVFRLPIPVAVLEQSVPLAVQEPPLAIQEQSELRCPKGFTVFEEGETLHITWRWSNSGDLGWVFSLLPLLLVSFVIVLIVSNSPSAIGWLLISLFVPILLVILYFFLANLINRTDISVTRQCVSVQDIPIHLRNNLKVNTVDIDQFYCVRIENVQKTRETYSVEYLTLSGTRHRLIHVVDKSQALFIEHAIEQFLGIDDRPVPGEMRHLNARRG